MNSVVSVIGYIFCVIFLGALITLVVMMCINEFRRFFGTDKKSKENKCKDNKSVDLDK